MGHWLCREVVGVSNGRVSGGSAGGWRWYCWRRQGEGKAVSRFVDHRQFWRQIWAERRLRHNVRVPSQGLVCLEKLWRLLYEKICCIVCCGRRMCGPTTRGSLRLCGRFQQEEFTQLPRCSGHAKEKRTPAMLDSGRVWRRQAEGSPDKEEENKELRREPNKFLSGNGGAREF